jgi:hypothetical protein
VCKNRWGILIIIIKKEEEKFVCGWQVKRLFGEINGPFAPIFIASAKEAISGQERE